MPPLILVVDDSREFRGLIEQTLSHRGYRVKAADDRVEALHVLRSVAVDLLIASDMNGRDEAAGLPELHAEFPGLPLVIMSARGLPDPRLHLGPAADSTSRTLLMPFRLSELLAITRELVGPGE
jgi:two-component system phosphate regulon response regulator OmpR